MKVGFPSKFSLNKIRENERTKFLHFRSQFSRISMYFWRNFRLHFCEIFVQFSFDKNQKFSISYQEDCIFVNKKDLKGKVKHEHEHGRKHEHDNKFRESFERISQKWTNIFVFGHIFPNWKLNKIDKRSKRKKFEYFIQSIFILFWKKRCMCFTALS